MRRQSPKRPDRTVEAINVSRNIVSGEEGRAVGGVIHKSGGPAKSFHVAEQRALSAPGVTPSIREAWPRVIRRTAFSFWRTSFERPPMAS